VLPGRVHATVDASLVEQHPHLGAGGNLAGAANDLTGRQPGQTVAAPEHGQRRQRVQAAGGEPDDLVSVVVFTTDMSEYRASLRELGEVWRRHFGRRYPAMALIGASSLFEPDARVELMGVAVVPE